MDDEKTKQKAIEAVADLYGFLSNFSKFLLIYLCTCSYLEQDAFFCSLLNLAGNGLGAVSGRGLLMRPIEATSHSYLYPCGFCHPFVLY